MFAMQSNHFSIHHGNFKFASNIRIKHISAKSWTDIMGNIHRSNGSPTYSIANGNANGRISTFNICSSVLGIKSINVLNI